MAYEIPGFAHSRPSAADYSVKATSGQFRFVAIEAVTGDAITATATTGPVIGVRQNLPRDGEAMTIVSSGISKIEFGQTVAAGALVKVMADGKAGAAITVGDVVVGQCIDGGAINTIGTVLLSTPALVTEVSA